MAQVADDPAEAETPPLEETPELSSAGRLKAARESALVVGAPEPTAGFAWVQWGADLMRQTARRKAKLPDTSATFIRNGTTEVRRAELMRTAAPEVGGACMHHERLVLGCVEADVCK